MVGWNLTSSVNPLTVIMDADRNLTANFTTGGGGGGLPSAAFMLFFAPASGGVSINNGVQETQTPQVTLNLNSRTDTVNMAISNTPDFYGAGQEPYQQIKQWILPKGGGQKIVYAKFFNKWGQPSQTVTAAINLTHRKQQIIPHEQ